MLRVEPPNPLDPPAAFFFFKKHFLSNVFSPMSGYQVVFVLFVELSKIGDVGHGSFHVEHVVVKGR